MAIIKHRSYKSRSNLLASTTLKVKHTLKLGSPPSKIYSSRLRLPTSFLNLYLSVNKYKLKMFKLSLIFFDASKKVRRLHNIETYKSVK